MPHRTVHKPIQNDFKDPYYYALVGLTAIGLLMLAWTFTPWFPWT